MQLIRWGVAGAERPGVLLDGARKDCSAHFADWTPEFFRTGGLQALAALIDAGTRFTDVPVDARWPPASRGRARWSASD